jgi:hypothetical protein
MLLFLPDQRHPGVEVVDPVLVIRNKAEADAAILPLKLLASGEAAKHGVTLAISVNQDQSSRTVV